LRRPQGPSAPRRHRNREPARVWQSRGPRSNRRSDHDGIEKSLHKSASFAILIGFAAAVAIALPACAAAPQVRTQAPGYYRVILGDFEVTALLDGTHPFPDAAVPMKPRVGLAGKRSKLFDDDAQAANALLTAADLKVPTEGSINAFLINTLAKLILIDSGASSLYGACCRHLIENPRASGYRPEQVDETLLTHRHADHVGGIAPGGKMVFPNAVVRASKLDADYWLNDANEKVAPAFLRPMFEGDKASLKPYIEAGRFKPSDGDPENCRRHSRGSDAGAYVVLSLERRS
jgi:glyoxylase-like metal-dependent hydrolase (beta-lactamase superfamily II)